MTNSKYWSDHKIPHLNFSVSPFASDLLIGLLDKDHRKRYDLKMIEKHEWVKHGPDTGDSLESIEKLNITDQGNAFEV